MRRRCASPGLLLLAFAACTTALRAAEPAPAEDPGLRLSAAARDLLAAVRTTSYTHRVAIDPASGSADTDCSGLVVWLLARELPAHLAAIPAGAGHRRPLAADFADAFRAGAPGWQPIARLADARPGDVLAWRFRDPRPGAATGHVMIVDGAPVQTDDGVWTLAVIDATSQPHQDDTRGAADGVGRGVISLRTDADGGIAAVSVGGGAAFRAHVFALARPVAR